LGLLEPNEVKKLMDEGFTFNSHKARIHNIFMAFLEYKTKFGNCAVQEDFQIPKDDMSWSENVRGIDLGTVLHKMRHNRLHFSIHPQLTEIGVDLSSTVSVDRSINFVLFKKYKEVYGNLKVPEDFIVPHDNQHWPQIYWYYEFGAYVHAIKLDITRNSQKYRKEDLIKLKSWGLNPTMIPKIDVFCSALEAYKKVHGTLEIPRKFKIPLDDTNYPQETWGLPLGDRCYNVHRLNLFAIHRQKLNEIGFYDSPDYFKIVPRYEFDEVYAALESYKRHTGGLVMSAKFVIASGDANYSSDMWGMKLGQ
jgi:hypothetical protein